jgi:hypothetical protein
MIAKAQPSAGRREHDARAIIGVIAAYLRKPLLIQVPLPKENTFLDAIPLDPLAFRSQLVRRCLWLPIKSETPIRSLPK